MLNIFLCIVACLSALFLRTDIPFEGQFSNYSGCFLRLMLQVKCTVIASIARCELNSNMCVRR